MYINSLLLAGTKLGILQKSLEIGIQDDLPISSILNNKNRLRITKIIEILDAFKTTHQLSPKTQRVLDNQVHTLQGISAITESSNDSLQDLLEKITKIRSSLTQFSACTKKSTEEEIKTISLTEQLALFRDKQIQEFLKKYVDTTIRTPYESSPAVFTCFHSMIHDILDDEFGSEIKERFIAQSDTVLSHSASLFQLIFTYSVLCNNHLQLTSIDSNICTICDTSSLTFEEIEHLYSTLYSALTTGYTSFKDVIDSVLSNNNLKHYPGQDIALKLASIVFPNRLEFAAFTKAFNVMVKPDDELLLQTALLISIMGNTTKSQKLAQILKSEDAKQIYKELTAIAQASSDAEKQILLSNLKNKRGDNVFFSYLLLYARTNTEKACELAQDAVSELYSRMIHSTPHINAYKIYDLIKNSPCVQESVRKELCLTLSKKFIVHDMEKTFEILKAFGDDTIDSFFRNTLLANIPYDLASTLIHKAMSDSYFKEKLCPKLSPSDAKDEVESTNVVQIQTSSEHIKNTINNLFCWYFLNNNENMSLEDLRKVESFLEPYQTLFFDYDQLPKIIERNIQLGQIDQAIAHIKAIKSPEQAILVSHYKSSMIRKTLGHMTFDYRIHMMQKLLKAVIEISNKPMDSWKIISDIADLTFLEKGIDAGFDVLKRILNTLTDESSMAFIHAVEKMALNNEDGHIAFIQIAERLYSWFNTLEKSAQDAFVKGLSINMQVSESLYTLFSSFFIGFNSRKNSNPSDVLTSLNTITDPSLQIHAKALLYLFTVQNNAHLQDFGKQLRQLIGKKIEEDYLINAIKNEMISRINLLRATFELSEKPNLLSWFTEIVKKALPELKLKKGIKEFKIKKMIRKEKEAFIAEYYKINSKSDSKDVDLDIKSPVNKVILQSMPLQSIARNSLEYYQTERLSLNTSTPNSSVDNVPVVRFLITENSSQTMANIKS